VMSLRVRVLLGTFIAIALVFFVGWLILSMGILGKLFGSKGSNDSISASNHTAQAHQEDWAAYLSTIDNEKVGSIMVDLGLKPIAPIPSKPIRLRINVPMNHPSESGLPLPEEFESLNEVDEKLSITLTSKIGAIYAGHLYCQGTMSLYYYIGENILHEPAIREAMSAFPDYKFESKVDREEEWESYTEFLYPLPIQMQSIHNQKVVENLRNSGDKLEKRRPVDHMIYFKSETDIDGFLTEIKGKGFEVVARERTEVEGYTWSVLLRRDDPVDSKSVDEYVLYLWQEAHDANGEYNGWGSTMIRE